MLSSNAQNLRIEQIRKHVTIFEVLSRFGIDLEEATQQIKCPFHPDTSPSARVYADQNKVFCFTEQRSWDVIDAVQQQFTLSFEDACAWLEQEFGVPGIALTLQGSIRTQLSARTAPSHKLAADLVEQRLKESRHQIGFLQYTKLLTALDLSVYQLVEKTITVAEFTTRMGRIVGAIR